MRNKQVASVPMQMASTVFLVLPTLQPLANRRLVTTEATAIPGMVSSQGTTLKTQLCAVGKLSWK